MRTTNARPGGADRPPQNPAPVATMLVVAGLLVLLVGTLGEDLFGWNLPTGFAPITLALCLGGTGWIRRRDLSVAKRATLVALCVANVAIGVLQLRGAQGLGFAAGIAMLGVAVFFLVGLRSPRVAPVPRD